MSAKNHKDEKKLRTLRRALRKGRGEAYVDLLGWLQLHGYADTAGAARKLILERRVGAGSHVLGFRFAEVGGEEPTLRNEGQAEEGERVEVYWPYAPSAVRPEIYVKRGERVSDV